MNHIRYYDRSGRPISHAVWTALQARPAYARIGSDLAVTETGQVLVTTVWLGLSTVPGRGRPLLYQTLVAAGTAAPTVWRWQDLTAARRGHERVLAWVTSGAGVPPSDDAGLSPVASS